MKTHSGAKKRIKVTGSGKYMRGKGKSTYRRRSGEVELAPGDAKVANKLLGR
jgi:large subunit ribosomal protein L35